jgi:ABC-type sugar transport system permease subunit
MDGAGFLAIFRHIQFPMLVPTAMTNSVLALILGLDLLSQVLVTTGGGPVKETTTVGYYVYRLGWKDNQLAMAASFSSFRMAVPAAGAALPASVPC